MTIPFFKLHGLGNDFVLVDEMSKKPTFLQKKNLKSVLRRIADRKIGVGFDQFLHLSNSTQRGIHAKLRIFNADGSVAEMCGNGLRAAALYLWDRVRIKDRMLYIETDAGIRSAKRLAGEIIECEMGEPRILKTPRALARGVRLGGKTHHPFCVDSGVPHAIVFAFPKNKEMLAFWGRAIENHKAFPKRTNVDFVQMLSSHQLEVQMWERGVGITEACGTGAIAAVAAAMEKFKGVLNSPVEVVFAGGQAEVTWKGKGSPAYLRGTAELVYEGRLVVDIE